ncbi:anti-sigma factor domain-containing protein [Paenibacillus tarimensis]
MNRGVIMEIGKRHFVVMTPDGEFKKVPRRSGCRIGEEISLVQSAGTGRRFPSWLAAAAAAVLILVMVPQLFFKVPEVVAYVAMDINPSIELGVDRKERVRELRAWNKDGEAVIEGLAYKGLPAEQVAGEIMKRVQAGAYFGSGDGDVIITAVFINDTLQEAFMSDLTGKVDQAVKQTLTSGSGQNLNVAVTVLTAPKELRDEAAVHGVTSGKMAVYLLAKNQGYELSLEELKQDSIHKLTKDQGGLQEIIGPDSANDEQSKAVLGRMLKEEKAMEQKEKENEKEKEKEKEKQTTASDNKQGKNNGQPSGSEADKEKNKDQVEDKDKKKDKDKEKDKNDEIDTGKIDIESDTGKEKKNGNANSNGNGSIENKIDKDGPKDNGKSQENKKTNTGKDKNNNDTAVKNKGTDKDVTSGEVKGNNGDEDIQEDIQYTDPGKLKTNDNPSKDRKPEDPAFKAGENEERGSGRNEDKGGRENEKKRS